MPFASSDDRLPRRNARSFDLDDSAAKAAAWVWHLHTSKPEVTTEGRFISSQSRRRSSGNFDRKATRFQQEASSMTANTVGGGNKKETLMWDCGSKLYDTFELVEFGNRLDRSLMEVVPITPPQGQPQEQCHMKSPLHERGGILRTLSMPRSLSCQASKNQAQKPTASPNANKFKLSKSGNNGTRASPRGSIQKAATTKWSRVGKFMNVIKKLMVLHKNVSFVGCKRSTTVIESSLKPLDQISERKNSNMCTGDNQLLSNEKISRSNSGARSNYKLSIPVKDKSNHETSMADTASMQKKIRAYNSESLDSGLALNKKIRSKSESVSDGLLEHMKIRHRIKCSNLEDVNVKERIRDANHHEHVDHYEHLHHHHHHHHHHHYLHHNLGSQSARLSPESLSQICTEQSWLI